MNLSKLKESIKNSSLDIRQLDSTVLEQGYSGYLFYHLFKMQCITCSTGCSNAETIGEGFHCDSCSQGCANVSCAKCTISEALS